MRRSGLVLGLAAVCGLSSCAVAGEGDRGADVPWTCYEAESAKTTGTVVGVDFTGQTPAREASGRRYVQLNAPGQFIEFTSDRTANGVVVRYSIPDSTDGKGLDATLSLSINGQAATKLPLTSRYSHLYGAYPFSNVSGAGSPRNFWDETRVVIAVQPGDVVRLQKADDDAAAEYLIDFIELERIPASRPQPENSLSITDYGATPDDATDDRPALLAAIAAAKAQHKSVYLPRGQFVVGGPIDVSDVTLQGAGMWETTLVGSDDYSPGHRVSINGTGSNITLSDFAIVGKLNYRNDSEGNDGIGGSFGTGSVIRNLWIEHTKTGAWLTNSDGLLIEGCRFRNTIADGLNLCVGMHNTTVRNCSARNTGDDCFAMWPATYMKPAYPPGGNRFVRCTAQLPFLAQGFSLYGGDSNHVIDSVATDIPYGAGLFASTTFPTELGFRGATTFEGNRITRAGDREGAVGTVANQVDLVGVLIRDTEIIDSPHDAVRFMSVHGRALRDAIVDGLKIRNTGLAGAGHAIVSADDAVGSVTVSHVQIQDSIPFRNVSPNFVVTKGDGAGGLEENPPAVGVSDRH